MSYHVGLIGLAVMGANLARNMARNGFKTLVYNRTPEKTRAFISEFGSDYLQGSEDIGEFVKSLERPRKIILMVKAGEPVDIFLEKLLPHLESGDMVMDCGNSHYPDTVRREKMLRERGIHFFGVGVSGGEEGALNGPSIMPGGDREAYQEHIDALFQSIAAKDFGGGKCVTWIGENGAGHYVKMVHNGIEYAVMQLLAEVYDMLRKSYKLQPPQIREVFVHLHSGRLESFLTEISVKILEKRDDMGEGFLIDQILDKAGQKGTGKWTAIDAGERSVAVPSISEAVNARIISSHKSLRTQLSQTIGAGAYSENVSGVLSQQKFISALEGALSAGMLSAYAQGYALISTAARENNWSINLSEISRIWQGGCIIRAKILDFLHQTFEQSGQKDVHLLELPKIADEITATLPDLRSVVAHGVLSGIALPALSSSLSYLEGMRTSEGSANFLQGLRDFFGAHTFERRDRDGIFHADWE